MVKYQNNIKGGDCFASNADHAEMFCGDTLTAQAVESETAMPEWLPAGVSDYKEGTGRADVYYNRITGEYAQQYAPGYSFTRGLTADQAKQY